MLGHTVTVPGDHQIAARQPDDLRHVAHVGCALLHARAEPAEDPRGVFDQGGDLVVDDTRELARAVRAPSVKGWRVAWSLDLGELALAAGRRWPDVPRAAPRRGPASRPR
jgi:hypothetical protein